LLLEYFKKSGLIWPGEIRLLSWNDIVKGVGEVIGFADQSTEFSNSQVAEGAAEFIVLSPKYR